MGTRFDRFLKDFGARLQPTGLAKALDDRRLLAIVACTVVVFAIINWLVLAIVQFAFGEIATGLVDTALLAVGSLGAVWFFRTGNIDTYSKLALFSSAIGVLSVHILLGGYAWSGSYLLWGISNVVFAALFLSTRVTTFIGTAYLITSVVFIFLEQNLQDLRGARPDPALAPINTVQILISTTVILVPAAVLLREQIFDERSRSRRLMLNILPETIADRLQANPGVIADTHDECTVLFADLVGFTEHSREVSAQRLVEELNRIFVTFDHLVSKAGGEKIKTMGDGYMAAFGVPESIPDHIDHGCSVALSIIEHMSSINSELGTHYKVRVGVATGSAVAGVIGETKFTYDVWSDTVTLASRLERAAEPNTVLVSEEVAEKVSDTFTTTPRGEVDLKGRGPTPAYQLV